MDAIPLGALFAALIFLIILSAFFSGSETGLMTLNRYRLQHRAKSGHRGARRALRLLKRPDRLIGLILLGNNFVNILASSLSTIIALRLLGETGIAIAAGLLTLVILIFAEVAPKTLAALHPERIAYPAALIYTPLLKLLYPLVWVVNGITNGLLRLIGISPKGGAHEALSREELRTVVMEAGVMIPKSHQSMLLNLLDLEKIQVEDIMIPRNEIVGLDISQDIDSISDYLARTQYTRLPVYEESIDHVIGILHVRNILPLLRSGELSHDSLRRAMHPPYFIPEGTSLNRQLLNFQREGRRTGLVVDEYGDLLGMVTLEDILEEIVGEFTTDPSSLQQLIMPQEDGSVLVDAGINLRELNRALNIKLPTEGPKTLNGLILEHMETIPEAGTSMRLAGYPLDIVQIKDNSVKTVRLYPQLHRQETDEETD
ncbi:HlyC/CorC family transporter [Thiohalobacter sp. IOR34]|uniref:HlyC/CorC family transporter n=1 Tax=Thiohalobacter sp. IOR34 TaxID=3057176 RepID=UPI0025AF6590|nr:HlyC/CorC family transporter [Thiohalobacter sp. IOR34]WJW74782.1 HlyC/CorC family transporter [Thiohalobacter sp. IOR34]